MKLFQVLFTHYGPSDSVIGTYCYLLAQDDAAVLQWLLKLEKIRLEDPDEESAVDPASDWCDEHPEELERAGAMGLSIESDWWIKVKGPVVKLMEWWRGEYEEVTDSYYGVTQYNWKPGIEVTQDQVQTLKTLGIAQEA